MGQGLAFYVKSTLSINGKSFKRLKRVGVTGQVDKSSDQGKRAVKGGNLRSKKRLSKQAAFSIPGY